MGESLRGFFEKAVKHRHPYHPPPFWLPKRVTLMAEFLTDFGGVGVDLSKKRAGSSSCSLFQICSLIF